MTYSINATLNIFANTRSQLNFDSNPVLSYTVVGLMIFVGIMFPIYFFGKRKKTGASIESYGYKVINDSLVPNNGIYAKFVGFVVNEYVFETILKTAGVKIYCIARTERPARGSVFCRTLFITSIPDAYQHVLIKSLVNKGLGRTEHIRDYGKSNLKLESLFDKYFELRTAPGQGDLAKSIFSSQVQQHILNNMGEFDIEIRGTELYVYYNNLLPTNQLTSTVEVVDVFHTLLSNSINESALIKSAAGWPVLSKSTRTSWSWIVIISAILVLFVTMLFVRDSYYVWYFVGVFTTVCCILAFNLMRRVIRRMQYKKDMATGFFI